MNRIFSYLKYSSNLERLLLINSFIFLIYLFGKSFFIQWFGLSTYVNSLILKPWSIITYAFIHHNFIHLLSNLLVLYYIGDLFTTFFPKKQLLFIYFYGVVVAGILVLTVDYFLENKGVLIGASGAVTAIFVAVATKIPRYKIRLMFIGDVKLWVLASIWVGLSLLQLTTNNYSGAIAHIGGGIIGFIYVYLKWYQFDGYHLTALSSQKNSIKTNLKTVHKKQFKNKANIQNEKQQKIDRILDKISKSGYDSLSNEEKTFLFNQGK